MSVAIRGYRAQDEPSLIEVWNASLPHDPLSPDLFDRKVIQDPNVEMEWLSVAEEEGQILGFCLALIRRVPLEGSPIETDQGWITGMGVAPAARRKGIGHALLERSLNLFRQAGKTQVLISPYTPNYFAPGVDERYQEGTLFLQNRGFQGVSKPLAMEAGISDQDPSPWLEREARLAQRGILVRSLTPEDVPSFLGFLKAHMPPDWVRASRELLADAGHGLSRYDQIVLALRGHETLGYAQFNRERFGPFGVRQDLRGQGIGSAVLARCLLSMRGQGFQRAWFMWTDDATARGVYSRFGFRETRRFLILRKALEG